MSIFDKLFGSKKSNSNDSNPTNDENIIPLYDKDGNQFFIDKKVYKNEVLKDGLIKAWNDPEELYNLAVLTLQDGFYEEALAQTERLIAIDPDKERSTVMFGVASLKCGKLDEAEDVFKGYLAHNGNSPIVMTNLAKVFAEKGETNRAQEMLRDAVYLDPNQDNPLEWWGALKMESGGEDAFYQEMEKLSALPGSWRPQLWIARRLLESKKPDSAIFIYKKILDISPEAHDAYTTMTGDLGNNGYLIQMLELLLPIYDSEKHGLFAGANMLNACFSLGEKDAGLRLCDELDRLNRFDHKQSIDEFRKAFQEM